MQKFMQTMQTSYVDDLNKVRMPLGAKLLHALRRIRAAYWNRSFNMMMPGPSSNKIGKKNLFETVPALGIRPPTCTKTHSSACTCSDKRHACNA